MSIKDWLMEKDHEGRLIAVFYGWRNINWLLVWITWINLGRTLGSQTFLKYVGEVFNFPWTEVWAIVGGFVCLIMANIVATQSDKDDQRVAIPIAIGGLAAVASFVLRRSVFQLVITGIIAVSVMYEKVLTDKYRSKLKRSTPVAAIDNVTITTPDGKELKIHKTHTDEKRS